MTHGTQLVKALGSRNAYSRHLGRPAARTSCGAPALRPPAADPDPRPRPHRLFVVLGANPMASNGSLMTVPDFPGRLRELKARGGRMVVLDPRRTETAKVADEHHFVRPGTDAAVLLAMLHVVLREGLERVPEYVDGRRRRARRRRAVHPRAAPSGHPGCPPTSIRAAGPRARRRPSGPRSTAGSGVSTQGFGTVCAWAISCLNIRDRQPRPARRGRCSPTRRSTSSGAG